MKYEKYLPMGTIVMLKGGAKKVMITGFCLQTNENEIFDYTGCLYPEGYTSSNRILLFNHSEIEKVYSIGYSDDDDKKFKESLKKELEGELYE